MTQRQALETARKRAKSLRREYFIVWSHEPDDLPDQHYHDADDFEVNTFYGGSPVVATVQPDGCVEWA